MEYNKLIKDKFSSYFNFFKNKFNSKEANNQIKEHDNVKLVERKRKIFYFSKFTLDMNEILFIYQTIRNIKENVLKHMIDSIKYCAKDILRFLSNENDNEKIVIIFTICFLRVYINYRDDFTFEEFFSQDLINIFTKYNVFICNLHQFKVFSYAFFHQTMKEMKLSNYSELKNMNIYYDKTILEDQNILLEEVKSSEPQEKNKNFIYKFAHYTKNKLNISNIKSMMTKNMTPLISATERVVDMILSLNDDSKNHEKGKVTPKSKVEETNNINEEQRKGLLENKVYSKRILCELVKTENNSSENMLVMEISEKVSNLVDMILNQSQNKFYCIQDFLCYIVEINSELIRIFPEYKDLKDDTNLRFIVTAKNIYNLAFEIYFTIHDLYKVIFNFTFDWFRRFHYNI